MYTHLLCWLVSDRERVDIDILTLKSFADAVCACVSFSCGQLKPRPEYRSFLSIMRHMMTYLLMYPVPQQNSARVFFRFVYIEFTGRGHVHKDIFWTGPCRLFIHVSLRNARVISSEFNRQRKLTLDSSCARLFFLKKKWRFFFQVYSQCLCPD